MPTKKAAAGSATHAGSKKAGKKDKLPLAQASYDQCFWVTDGRILANLIELRDALDSMSKDVFHYHVTKERNDFADWIEHVLQDAELATKVRKSKKPDTARDVIVSRLRIYSF